tara:strand:- start:195 stop:365 length:171 start_codon:yes stop_codon:yes gene_type:complete
MRNPKKINRSLIKNQKQEREINQDSASHQKSGMNDMKKSSEKNPIRNEIVYKWKDE